MKKTATLYILVFIFSGVLSACRNEQQIKEQIQTNQALLKRKQDELSDLNYKITSNSLRVGTKDYDSTIGKDFNVRSGMLQASIDSLKAQTDSLQQLVPH
ncbi:MAG: hypothetical protein INR73_17870 [Williamsia sp.]|nr:hypothetical protein [Williamsia sp.]